MFGAAFRGSVNQIVVLHIKTKQRTVKRDDQTIMFWFTKQQIAAPKPMDLKSGITSKTKLPQQQWYHFHNIDIKCCTMSYNMPLEIFFHQDDENFYMCCQNCHFFEDSLQKKCIPIEYCMKLWAVSLFRWHRLTHSYLEYVSVEKKWPKKNDHKINKYDLLAVDFDKYQCKI